MIEVQWACKPDSVRPSKRECATISLDAASLRRSSSQPGSPSGAGGPSPLFGLAPGGVCPAGLLPARRCALTAPFHPYRAEARRYVSVALSVGSRRPGVTWHPARRSPDFPPFRGRAVTRSAVRSYRTISPLPATSRSAFTGGPLRAVSFLWHCPCSHERWELPTTASCGARTFLSVMNHAAITRSTLRAITV